MEAVRKLDPPTAVICQFARMGDVAQTLPLIKRLSRRYRLRLWCDRSVEPWAKAIPDVAEVSTLDSREWRRLCLTPVGLFLRSLKDCDGGLRAPIPDDLSPVIALNDHPAFDALLGWACYEHPGRWLTQRLILVRSYIRMIAGNRRTNRIHLADIWASMTEDGDELEGILPFGCHTGTRFAHPVWEEWKRRKSRRIWGMILGSGAKSRRLEPEVFARIWNGIPENIRPALVWIGGPGEEALGEKFLRAFPSSTLDILNLIGRCSPEEWIAILKDLEFVIGVDTGPLHWAAAMGTKVIGFYFAEAGFHDTGPYGEGHLVLAPDCPEYPCPPKRAEQCGRICRNAYQNDGEIAAFLVPLAGDEKAAWNRPPKDLRIYRSVLRDGWNLYESPAGVTYEEEAAEAFAVYARGIFRGSPPEMRRDLNRAVALLRQTWKAEAISMSFPRSVMVSEVERAKQEALACLNFDEAAGTAYENPAAERRLFSVEPARIGA